MNYDFRPKESIPLFDGFSLNLPFGLTCHRDRDPGGGIIFISDYLRSFTVSFEQGTDFYSMALQRPDSWLTWTENGKALYQRRYRPRPVRCMGNYTFFKMEMPDDEGRTVAITGQLITSSGCRPSDDTEPVLRTILRNITYRKGNTPSLQ